VSGKDSLNNEFSCEDGRQISIPSTLLVSTISIVDDINKCVTMDAKRASNLLFIVGETRNELGGSHYYKIHGQLGANIPKVDLEVGPKIAQRVACAIAEGLAVSCHDCSEGGLAVALAEMAFSGGLGIEADLRGLPRSDDCSRTDTQLFSESNSRYIVEVETENYDAFAKLMLNLPFGQIGKVIEEKTLSVRAESGETVIETALESLKEAWLKPLAW
jgi:phosphoribosylformylglycinamidine synthase